VCYGVRVGLDVYYADECDVPSRGQYSSLINEFAGKTDCVRGENNMTICGSITTQNSVRQCNAIENY